jgi:hypothetical protein
MMPLKLMSKYWFSVLLSLLLGVFTLGPAQASSDAHGAADTGAKPGRTFEGIEPLFYLDSKRRPYIEPFHKTDSDEFFICRGTIGDWYRQLNVRDFNKLAARDGLAEVTGSTCALQLIKTHTGKKMPIIAIQMFVSSDAMRDCVLTEVCTQARQVIVYLRQRTLYRTFILTDVKKRVHRQYCLDNQSEVIADTSCWKHFEESGDEKSH